MSDIKKILCLSRKDDRIEYDTAQSMVRNLQPGSQHIMYDACFLEELAFIYNDGELSVINTRDGSDIRTRDGIFLLGWFKLRKHEEAALAVSMYAQMHNVHTLNSEALHNRSRSKLSQCMAAALNGISTMPFVVVGDRHILAETVAVSGMPYPLVAKSTTGSRGSQNYLVHDKVGLQAALDDAPTKAFIVQPFVPNEGDYRILVMGGKVRLVIHRRAQSTSHLNNTSQGGAAMVVPLNAVPQPMLDDAVKISLLLKREVTGVDMIIDKNSGQHFFLEVNNMPQLSTGSFVNEKAAVLNQFFVEWLEEYSS